MLDFGRDGFWVSPPLYSPAEVQLIRDRFDAVLRGEYEFGAPHGVNRFGSAMVKVANAWWCDSVIRDVVRNRVIGQTAAEFLGVDEVYLWADSLYYKAPLTHLEQSVVGWHQDKQYWGCSSTDKMITACVALYEADALSGGMRFARGSHRWGLVGGSDALSAGDNAEPHGRPPVPPGQTWEEVCPHLQPGQVTFHHSLTFHGSGPNFSAEPRRSITIHMVAPEGRLVNWTPVNDGHLSTVGLGNLFRGPLFPRLWP